MSKKHEVNKNSPGKSENPKPEDSSEENVEKLNVTEGEELKIEDYEKNLEEMVKQSQEFFEGWQRERADFVNYKKRIEREQASLKNFVTSEIIKKYLVIIDDMELALKNQPQDQECANWVTGVNLIYQKLISILEKEGVEQIATDGEFDPNVHEALTQVESTDHESGHIVEVMRNGYRIGDRILRPALVVVAR
ncbi:MAG: nucleotide exchange factor GrpE [Chloroflexi bacterium 44-23]|nr:MAG: nucleotide exchange factor GrpE [Chloroflexi bacterium 44-23]